MSQLYLIRHGQAGPRDDYDRLSELGVRQAQLLGRHLAAQQARFDRAVSGRLVRQLKTAQIVADAYREAGVDFPQIEVVGGWDEFDLAAVYEAVAEPLARDDPEFARLYAEMQRELGDRHSAVHRLHNYCDIAVVSAWVEGRYEFRGESWPEFRARIEAALDQVRGGGQGTRTAVFTSATPIGISVAHALGLDERELWRIAGVAYNTSLTTFRAAHDELRLFSFNSLPHLPDPAAWSFR